MGAAASNLYHFIYVSASRQLMSDDDLMSLLMQARRLNEAEGITGMLVYSDGSFLQVLEGTPEAIDRVTGRICSDPRHRGIIPLLRGPIAKRCFGEWSMGFAHVGAEDLRHIPGFNDFFTEGRCLRDLDSSRAKVLLEQFHTAYTRV